MRKKITALVVGAMLMLGAASAWATPYPAEWKVISPTSTLGTPSIDPSADFGYFLWTDDLERTSWHMRWVDGPNKGRFSGTISLYDSTGSFTPYTFETGDSNWDYLTSDEFKTSMVNDVDGMDGLDFQLTQLAQPSYIGFDLFYNGYAIRPDMVFIGSMEQTVLSLGGDQDFILAAPVPEPGTMMLLGVGFLGLAIYGKRRKNV